MLPQLWPPKVLPLHYQAKIFHNTTQKFNLIKSISNIKSNQVSIIQVIPLMHHYHIRFGPSLRLDHYHIIMPMLMIILQYWRKSLERRVNYIGELMSMSPTISKINYYCVYCFMHSYVAWLLNKYDYYYYYYYGSFTPRAITQKQ